MSKTNKSSSASVNLWSMVELMTDKDLTGLQTPSHTAWVFRAHRERSSYTTSPVQRSQNFQIGIVEVFTEVLRTGDLANKTWVLHALDRLGTRTSKAGLQASAICEGTEKKVLRRAGDPFTRGLRQQTPSQEQRWFSYHRVYRVDNILDTLNNAQDFNLPLISFLNLKWLHQLTELYSAQKVSTSQRDKSEKR